jgi:hypothetical protein
VQPLKQTVGHFFGATVLSLATTLRNIHATATDRAEPPPGRPDGADDGVAAECRAVGAPVPGARLPAGT